jgi:hypothetical protein
MSERDPFLRRFERDGVVAAVLLASVAAIWSGEARAPLSVVGGGVLAAISYRAIKGGVEAVAAGGRGGAALVKFFTRHAILAVAAYVMLVRLRLHPLWVMAGASSLVAAAVAAAARFLRHGTERPAAGPRPPGA